MIDYSKFPNHNIICVDMKSFFASCECVMRGLSPITAKLAVVGDINRNGSVVLAASPTLKKEHNIKTGSRLYEIKELNDDSIIVVQSRMGKYLEMSEKISKIFETFVPPNHIHIYSVDESWLTLDGTEKLWGTPQETARKLILKIYEETGIVSAVGIGDNKFLAKFCLDNYAKKDGIDEIRFKDVKEKLHPLPVKDMWGIGERLSIRFNQMGIFTIGDLANFDLEKIKKDFGAVGEKLYWYAWGIDLAPVVYDKDNIPQSAFGYDGNISSTPKSIGRAITLLKDYKKVEDIKLIIREVAEEVCETLRRKNLEGKTITLDIQYSRHAKSKGFSRQKTIKIPTNDLLTVSNICYELFDKFYTLNSPVRLIRVSVGKIQIENTDTSSLNEETLKRKKIADTKDKLNDRFGRGIVSFGSSLKEESVSKERTKKARGHYE